MDLERDELALAATTPSPSSEQEEAWLESADVMSREPDADDTDLRLARWLKNVDR